MLDPIARAVKKLQYISNLESMAQRLERAIEIIDGLDRPEVIRAAFELDYFANGPRVAHSAERAGDSYKSMGMHSAWMSFQAGWKVAITGASRAVKDQDLAP